jgi:LysM repeat protein
MYNFYLDRVLLPVAPSKLTLRIKNQNKTLELMNLGEINILKKAGLTSISFECLLPGREYPFAEYQGGFKESSFYLEHLEKLKIDQKPFRFLISRLSPSGGYLFGTNMEVSLEEYSIVEDASNGQDITVSVELKQYKHYATQKLQTISNQGDIILAKAVTERPAKEPAKSYTVKSGDTLWAICKRELGDGSIYAAVAAANGIKNPNLIYPGQVISLEVIQTV